MTDLDHEEIIVRTGARSGLPVIIAVHSTVLGQAVGGCRLWRYAYWRDGLEDALRLSVGMTRKCAAAGLANGGGKTVVAVPEGTALDALGGVFTSGIVPRLRCAAIAGPANNQLAEPAVAEQLQQRGILWAPDYVVGAGGVIYALAVELHKASPETALARVQAIGDTIGLLLDTAERAGADPAQAALELAGRRLSAATCPPTASQAAAGDRAP